MTDEKKRDFTLKISQANKTALIAILYDIGIAYIDEATETLSLGDQKGFRIAVERIRSTIHELMNSVNSQTELGRTFMRLYIFANCQLTKAFIDYDAKPLEPIKRMFTQLGEAYVTLAASDPSGPVMENTENVYEGFTYNRNLRNENVADINSSRGFYV